jgi:dsRNA-specific ribonuclease
MDFVSLNEEETKTVMNDGDFTKSDESNELIFNPYNNANVEISSQDIFNILTKYDIPPEIDNIELYKRAFVHRSYIKRPIVENNENGITIVDKPDDCLSLKTKSNERLEFLGDGVLECITKYYLYRRFPKENEGFMTEKKIALVKNEAIGKIAYEMGLHKWFVISRHSEEKKSRTNLKKLGCLFESFLGALFLDFNKQPIYDEKNLFKDFFVTGPGFQMAQKFIENVYHQHVDWVALIKNDDNYKNILQVKVQKEFKTTPVYLELERNIDEGYIMGVCLILGIALHEVDKTSIQNIEYYNGWSGIIDYYKEHDQIVVLLGTGKHKIKKKAEQLACQIAISCIS